MTSERRQGNGGAVPRQARDEQARGVGGRAVRRPLAPLGHGRDGLWPARKLELYYGAGVGGFEEGGERRGRAGRLAIHGDDPITHLDLAVTRRLRVGLHVCDDVVDDPETQAQRRLRELYRVGRRAGGRRAGGGGVGGEQVEHAVRQLAFGVGGEVRGVEAGGGGGGVGQGCVERGERRRGERSGGEVAHGGEGEGQRDEPGGGAPLG